MGMNGAAVLFGFLLDLWLGDPQNPWHPVRGIGWLTSVLEKGLRHIFRQDQQGELVAGVVEVIGVLMLTGSVSWLLCRGAGQVHPGLKLAVMSIMCYLCLATHSLKAESMKVYQQLEKGDVEGAHQTVAMIVGRDTKRLTPEGIIKATVETVAENASDGVIAPLLYLFLAGPPGGFLYKAVNTMDSMIGYQNDRYRFFGRAAAKLDDLVNLIPARISALLFIAAAYLAGIKDQHFNGKQAWIIWHRDNRCHTSPNSAQGEAACAGALGIQLAGDAWYFGVLHHKPVIGDPVRPVENEDIRRVNQLLYISAALAVLLGIGVIGIICVAGGANTILHK